MCFHKVSRGLLTANEGGGGSPQEQRIGFRGTDTPRRLCKHAEGKRTFFFPSNKKNVGVFRWNATHYK